MAIRQCGGWHGGFGALASVALLVLSVVPVAAQEAPGQELSPFDAEFRSLTLLEAARPFAEFRVFDLDEDGDVDATDAQALEARAEAGEAAESLDLTGDGLVDAADADWLRLLAGEGGGGLLDVDGSGAVDIDDYRIGIDGADWFAAFIPPEPLEMAGRAGWRAYLVPSPPMNLAAVASHAQERGVSLHTPGLHLRRLEGEDLDERLRAAAPDDMPGRAALDAPIRRVFVPDTEGTLPVSTITFAPDIDEDGQVRLSIELEDERFAPGDAVLFPSGLWLVGTGTVLPLPIPPDTLEEHASLGLGTLRRAAIDLLRRLVAPAEAAPPSAQANYIMEVNAYLGAATRYNRRLEVQLSRIFSHITATRKEAERDRCLTLDCDALKGPYRKLDTAVDAADATKALAFAASDHWREQAARSRRYAQRFEEAASFQERIAQSQAMLIMLSDIMSLDWEAAAQGDAHVVINSQAQRLAKRYATQAGVSGANVDRWAAGLAATTTHVLGKVDLLEKRGGRTVFNPRAGTRLGDYRAEALRLKRTFKTGAARVGRAQGVAAKGSAAWNQAKKFGKAKNVLSLVRSGLKYWATLSKEEVEQRAKSARDQMGRETRRAYLSSLAFSHSLYLARRASALGGGLTGLRKQFAEAVSFCRGLAREQGCAPGLQEALAAARSRYKARIETVDRRLEELNEAYRKTRDKSRENFEQARESHAKLREARAKASEASGDARERQALRERIAEADTLMAELRAQQRADGIERGDLIARWAQKKLNWKARLETLRAQGTEGPAADRAETLARQRAEAWQAVEDARERRKMLGREIDDEQRILRRLRADYQAALSQAYDAYRSCMAKRGPKLAAAPPPPSAEEVVAGVRPHDLALATNLTDGLLDAQRAALAAMKDVEIRTRRIPDCRPQQAAVTPAPRPAPPDTSGWGDPALVAGMWRAGTQSRIHLMADGKKVRGVVAEVGPHLAGWNYRPNEEVFRGHVENGALVGEYLYHKYPPHLREECGAMTRRWVPVRLALEDDGQVLSGGFTVPELVPKSFLPTPMAPIQPMEIDPATGEVVPGGGPAPSASIEPAGPCLKEGERDEGIAWLRLEAMAAAPSPPAAGDAFEGLWLAENGSLFRMNPAGRDLVAVLEEPGADVEHAGFEPGQTFFRGRPANGVLEGVLEIPLHAVPACRNIGSVPVEARLWLDDDGRTLMVQAAAVSLTADCKPIETGDWQPVRGYARRVE